ncbi:transposase [Candidatus Poribacteria bacterium]|nr:transposase [Candidatus Poribacteria bacterium]
MIVLRADKTDLALNNKQRTSLAQHAGTARFAYNWGLSRKIETFKSGQKTPTAIELHRELNSLKKTDFPWMYEVSKCAPQEALRHLDKAFANFFRRVATKRGSATALSTQKAGMFTGKVGFPKFNSKKPGQGSFRLTGSIRIEVKRIKLPRLGWLRLKESGYLPTDGIKILNATVSERAGRWFVSVQVEHEVVVEKARGEPCGVDLGINS